MDVLKYYLNDRCVARFLVPRDEKIRNLGSAPDNQFVIPNPQVAPVQIQIQYQIGVYQFLVVTDTGMSLESFQLPTNMWLDLPGEKKLWLDTSHQLGYLSMENDAATKAALSQQGQPPAGLLPKPPENRTLPKTNKIPPEPGQASAVAMKPLEPRKIRDLVQGSLIQIEPDEAPVKKPPLRVRKVEKTGMRAGFNRETDGSIASLDMPAPKHQEPFEMPSVKTLPNEERPATADLSAIQENAKVETPRLPPKIEKAQQAARPIPKVEKTQMRSACTRAQITDIPPLEGEKMPMRPACTREQAVDIPPLKTLPQPDFKQDIAVAKAEESLDATQLQTPTEPPVPEVPVTLAPSGGDVVSGLPGAVEPDTLVQTTPGQPGTGEKQGEFLENQLIAERYRVVEVLGKGGMGIVYKVRDEKLQRFAALKLLLPKDQQATEMMKRFYAEATTMGKLRHPNIVAVHDNGVFQGRPYFVMDIIEGKDLPKQMDELKPRQAMQWMLSICQAVHYIHQAGIIHRDLKPSNILISKQNEPVLMDFGIARDESRLSGLTGSGQFLGTPAYMAPEQARGLSKEIGPATDVYGLGAILYEMLTKQPPFSGPPMQVIYKVCTSEPIPIHQLAPTIPKDIITIVEKAMAKEKAFRYSSAQAMAEDIKRYLEGLRIHSRPLPVFMKLVMKFRRNRSISYVGIAVCALLFLVGVSVLWGGVRAKRQQQAQIKQLLQEAADHLNQAQVLVRSEAVQNKDEEGKLDDPIAHYVEASDKCTRVLGLEKDNLEARRKKFQSVFGIADYASAKLRDYNFARVLYHSAKVIAVANEQADQINDVEEALQTMSVQERQEKLVSKNLLSQVLERLRKEEK